MKKRFLQMLILCFILSMMIPTLSFANETASTGPGIHLDTPIENPEDTEVIIRMVGDNLIHYNLITTFANSDGSFDFSPIFSAMLPDIQSADIAIINQETILCEPSLGYSGYPTFGSPTALGDAIYDAGFDVVLHATNHTMDKGTKGIENTLSFWSTTYPDIQVVGIASSAEESSKICVIEKKGIKVAILNYTYGLNGFVRPKHAPYLVNLLSDRNKMKIDIANARTLADIVIVAPHWGNEYVYQPVSSQKELTNFFYEQGVDIVIGTHPHVLEPMEWIQKENNEHQMLVYYSLGNFVSAQSEIPRLLGGMAEITLQKKDDCVSIKKADMIPLVTHFEYNQVYTTYRLDNYNDDLATRHSIHSKFGDAFNVSALKILSHQILGDSYPLE